MGRAWNNGMLVLVLGAAVALPAFAQDSLAQPPRWVAMTDSTGRVIGLREDQQQGWKARSAKWDEQYRALGQDPEHKPTYITLHSARDFDLRRFLTGKQYDRWKELSKRSKRLEHGNPPGTNMPPDR